MPTRTDSPFHPTKRKKYGGRAAGVPNKIDKDLREGLINSWHALGGRKYLERLGRTHPAVYASLLAKVIPAEIRHSFQGSYEALPIPVEVREAGPLLAAADAGSQALMDALGQQGALTDDWLAVSDTPAHIAPDAGLTSAYGPMVNDTSAIEGEWDAVPVVGVDRGTG